MASDPLTISDLDDNHEDELQASDANASALMNPNSMFHSGVILSLLHQMCSAYEKDPGRREKMFSLICQQMSKRDMLPHQGMIDTFSPVQAAYTKAFRQMMQAARDHLHDESEVEHRMLSLPATEQERTALLLQIQSPLLRQPKITPEEVIFSSTTRYETDFVEHSMVGKGGFGKVFKVHSRLDQRYYAIKKIKLKQTNIEKSYKLVKEVKLLAGLKHSNVVGYNTSWIEAEPVNPANSYKDITKREPVTSLKCLPSSSESPRSSSEQESSTRDKNEVRMEDVDNKGEESPGLWIPKATASPLRQYMLQSPTDCPSTPSRFSRSPSDSTSTIANSPGSVASSPTTPKAPCHADSPCRGGAAQSADVRTANEELSFTRGSSVVRSGSSHMACSSDAVQSVNYYELTRFDSYTCNESNDSRHQEGSFSCSVLTERKSKTTELYSSRCEQDSCWESDIQIHSPDSEYNDLEEEFSDMEIAFATTHVNDLEEIGDIHIGRGEAAGDAGSVSETTAPASGNDCALDINRNAWLPPKEASRVMPGTFGPSLSTILFPKRGGIQSNVEIVNLDETREPKQNNKRRHRSKSDDGLGESQPKPGTRVLSRVPRLEDFPMFRVVLYIQMQLCSNTLSDWLRQRNMKTQQAKHSLDVVDMDGNMHIFKQILDGMHYIHSQGVIHRDLKPKNIFLETSGSHLQVLIGDFGLAKEDVLVEGITLERRSHDLAPDYHDGPQWDCASKSAAHTAAVGTTTYASPEQLQGTHYDCKSDMYSSGIILFEMFHPFSTQMERAKVIDALRAGNIPSEVHNRWPDQGKTIGQLTHSDRCQRPHAADVLRGPLFQSKDEVIKDLQKKLSEKDAEIQQLKQRMENLEKGKKQCKCIRGNVH